LESSKFCRGLSSWTTARVVWIDEETVRPERVHRVLSVSGVPHIWVPVCWSSGYKKKTFLGKAPFVDLDVFSFTVEHRLYFNTKAEDLGVH